MWSLSPAKPQGPSGTSPSVGWPWFGGVPSGDWDFAPQVTVPSESPDLDTVCLGRVPSVTLTPKCICKADGRERGLGRGSERGPKPLLGQQGGRPEAPARLGLHGPSSGLEP